MVETLTKVATKSITSTKLAIATLAALAAGGAAFAVAPPVFLTGPDLIVSDIVFDNAAKKATVTVKNIGKTKLNTAEVATAWSTTIIPNSKPRLVSGLNPGVAVNFVLPYPARIPSALTATIDPNNKVKEMRENNNTLTKTLPSFCSDSDNGLDTTVVGTMRGCQFEDCATIMSHTDCCTVLTSVGTTGCTATGTHLLEGTCTGNVGMVPLVECKNGCANGVCLDLPDLTISDVAFNSYPTEPIVVTIKNIGNGNYDPTISTCATTKVYFLDKNFAVLGEAVPNIQGGCQLFVALTPNSSDAVGYVLDGVDYLDNVEWVKVVISSPYNHVVELREDNNESVVRLPKDRLNTIRLRAEVDQPRSVQYGANQTLAIFDSEGANGSDAYPFNDDNNNPDLRSLVVTVLTNIPNQLNNWKLVNGGRIFSGSWDETKQRIIFRNLDGDRLGMSQFTIAADIMMVSSTFSDAKVQLLIASPGDLTTDAIATEFIDTIFPVTAREMNPQP